MNNFKKKFNILNSKHTQVTKKFKTLPDIIVLKGRDYPI